MADNYCRLVCLLMNVGQEPVRKLFLKLAKSDQNQNFTDLDAYLLKRKHQIANLQTIRRDQYGLIFPSVGNADISNWDLTLLVNLIYNLFNVPNLERCLLDELRGIRNGLQHQANSSSISNSEFDFNWNRLANATKTLARQVDGTAYEDEISKQIEEARTNNLPALGDSLRSFYDEHLKEMSAKMYNLEQTVNDLNAKFLSATVTKPGPTGRKEKRFKTVDNILHRLIKQFQSTMQTELNAHFLPPRETADIRTKLKDNHHVVVAGSRNRPYLETALFVINELDYSPERCVEINDSSEWRHIDPGEVDLVLIKDPFGTVFFKKRKARSMMDIFDSILNATQPRDDVKTVDVIIVTDVDCLDEATRLQEHDLLGEVVKFFEPTSESEPADLTTVSPALAVSNNNKTSYSRQMTDIFLSRFSEESKRMDVNFVKDAKDILKTNKMLLITGPVFSGKSSLAVTLAQSYPKEEVLLLTSPDKIDNIDFQSTSLVIVDDFVGKYGFRKEKVTDWFLVFVQLYDAVNAGKLNIIVTCDTSKLEQCTNEIAKHPLLSNSLSMTQRPTYIKHESSETSATSAKPAESAFRLASTNVLGHVRSVKLRTPHKQEKGHNQGINSCCMLPDNKMLVANDNHLFRINSSYQVAGRCECMGASGVCFLGDNTAVVCANTKLVYVDVKRLRVKKKVKTEHPCKGIARHNNTLFVLSKLNLYTYTLDGKKRSVIYINRFKESNPDPFNCLKQNLNGIAVSNDGSRLYLTTNLKNLITIDCSGNHRNTLWLDDRIQYIFVDDRDNVWVCVRFYQLIQICADGARLLKKIETENSGKLFRPLTMCYDRDRSYLIGTGSKKVEILKLK